jgi:hypothetical protein
MIGNIEPLTTIKGTGTYKHGPLRNTALYKVVCRECGDVTREESGFSVDEAPLITASLYRQRHLARHLAALSNEMTEAAR